MLTAAHQFFWKTGKSLENELITFLQLKALQKTAELVTQRSWFSSLKWEESNYQSRLPPSDLTSALQQNLKGTVLLWFTFQCSHIPQCAFLLITCVCICEKTIHLPDDWIWFWCLKYTSLPSPPSVHHACLSSHICIWMLFANIFTPCTFGGRCFIVFLWSRPSFVDTSFSNYRWSVCFAGKLLPWWCRECDCQTEFFGLIFHSSPVSWQWSLPHRQQHHCGCSGNRHSYRWVAPLLPARLLLPAAPVSACCSTSAY